MTDQQYTEINGLLEKYPKAAKKLIEWFTPALLGFRDELLAKSKPVPETEPVTDELVKEFSIGVVSFSPYILFRFFDESSIYITFTFDPYSDEGFFIPVVYKGNENKMEIKRFPNRQEAEKAAFEQAFSVLENISE